MKKLIQLMLSMTLTLIVSNAFAAEDFYALNAGDRLTISVWNEEALQKDVVILPDGTIG